MRLAGRRRSDAEMGLRSTGRAASIAAMKNSTRSLLIYSLLSTILAFGWGKPALGDERMADPKKSGAAPGAQAMQAPDSHPAPSDVAAPPADANKTASGLASKVVKAGTGKEHPKPEDIVKVNYVGWQTTGMMFDASDMHGGPATFPLNRVIAGWTEGVQLMVVGEKRRLWIPESLAYKGRPGAPSGMLVFDVELLDIKLAPKAPATPADVAAPPKGCQKSKTGLASIVIKPGTGKAHPTETSTVTVNYTGWTTDGKLFDSSITAGEPATFPLNGVIAGWTEGVQLMVEGERRRFWIPQDLAYKGQQGAPAGMLVFDVELLKIGN
jgi:peptidylprolyl isomerase